MIGKFKAKLKEIGIAKTKKTGMPQVACVISIFPTVEQIENAQAEGIPNAGDFELPYYMQLVSERVDITFDILKTMGFKIDVETILPNIANGTGWDKNKEFEVDVISEEYDGKFREVIKSVFEIGSSSIRKLPANEALILMKGLNIKETVASYLSGAKPAGEKLPPREAPETKESDIPNW